MVVSKNIPMQASTFIRRCVVDRRLGRYAQPPSKYRDFLHEHTEQHYKTLLRLLTVFDRQKGEQRLTADADHIVPKSVWPLLMPASLQGRMFGKFPEYSGVLSNLFWRHSDFNREDDDPLITQVMVEARRYRRGTKEWAAWAANRIECFLHTKHDEPTPVSGIPTDPAYLDAYEALHDPDSQWLALLRDQPERR